MSVAGKSLTSFRSNQLSYEQAITKVVSLQLFGMCLGIGRMERLVNRLGCPNRSFDTIHVVGTNGKTSTAKMVAEIISPHGLKTAAYFSPHLLDVCERMQVDGASISRECFAESVADVYRASLEVEAGLAEGEHITQFEFLTAVAFYSFARQGVDVAVVEAGLGGRFDATNVIGSELTVLTNISLDHTQWLGHTEAEICAEKVAVVPAGGRLICGKLGDEILALARGHMSSRGGEIMAAGCDFGWSMEDGHLHVKAKKSYERLRLAVAGAFQRDNFTLAVAAAEAYLGPLELEQVRQVARSVRVAGRMEIVSNEPLVIYDGAHNPSGIDAMVASLDEVATGREVVGLVSVLNDKDARSMIRPLVGRCDSLVCTRSSHPRALSARDLAEICTELGAGDVAQAEDVEQARLIALGKTDTDGALLATGSLYLISDLLHLDAGLPEQELITV